MKAKLLPSVEFLRECFDYDPESGVIKWRVRPESHFPGLFPHRERNRWNTRFAKTEAGQISPSGYRIINVGGGIRAAGRIIWKLMTGSDPVHEVDHENTISADNRWVNLRSATRSQNNFNQKVRKTNRLGVKGVYLRSKNRYGARIMRNKKLIDLGSFPTAEEAHIAYCVAAKGFYGEYWNPGI